MEKINKMITPAGKTCYLQPETSIVRPQDFLKQKMEEKFK